MVKNSLPARAKRNPKRVVKVGVFFFFFPVGFLACARHARVRSRARGKSTIKSGFWSGSLDKSQTTFNKHPKKEGRKSEEKVRITFNG